MTAGLLALVTTLAGSACTRSPVAVEVERIIATPVPTPSPSPKRVVRRSAAPSPRPSGRALGADRRWPGYGWPWQAVADCESGKRRKDGSVIPLTADWDLENPPYTGGLQFNLSTWRLAGGLRFAPTAGQATPEQQIEIAAAWLDKTSWSQWPDCSRRLGLRRAA